MTKKDTAQNKKVHCANCFACFAETEFCPLEPDYDEEKVMAELEKRMSLKSSSATTEKSDQS